MKNFKIPIKVLFLFIPYISIFSDTEEAHYFQPEDLTPFIYNDQLQTYKSTMPPQPTDQELVYNIRRYLVENYFYSEDINTFDIRSREGNITIIGNIPSNIELGNLIIDLRQIYGVKSVNVQNLNINPKATHGFIREN